MVTEYEEGEGPELRHETTLNALGSCVRHLRRERGLTLQELSSITGLSPSMISLVERGRTSPSIGTLVALSSGLEVPMSDLFSTERTGDDRYVTRLEDQPVVETQPGYSRRLVKVDRVNHAEYSVLWFEPEASTHEAASGHRGVEYGLVLEGVLTVELGDESYVLDPGDCISYPSSEPHRMLNEGTEPVRAVWMNIGIF